MPSCEPSQNPSILKQESALDSKTLSFIKWMRETGFGLDGIEIRETIDSGRGCFATRDLPPEHVLFRVPQEAILSASSSRFCRYVEASSFSGWKALIAVLTFEYANIENSFWGSYLKALPKTLSTPLFWTRKELDMLDGIGIVDRMNLNDIDRVFESEILPFYKRHEDALSEQLLTKEFFVWLGSIIMAYSFTLDENETVMMPMADFLNSRTNYTNAHLVQSENESGGGLMFEMTTISSVKKGAQIYNTYGKRPNAELFRRYGYVDEPNPYNMVCFSPAELYAEVDDSGVACSKLNACLRKLRKTGELVTGSSLACAPFCMNDGGILVSRNGRVLKGVAQGIGIRILRKAAKTRLLKLSRSRETKMHGSGARVRIARILNEEESEMLERLCARIDRIAERRRFRV